MATSIDDDGVSEVGNSYCAGTRMPRREHGAYHHECPKNARTATTAILESLVLLQSICNGLGTLTPNLGNAEVQRLRADAGCYAQVGTMLKETGR